MKPSDLIRACETGEPKLTRAELTAKLQIAERILDAITEEMEKDGKVLECSTRGYIFVQKEEMDPK